MQPLADKVRPQSLKDFVGHTNLTDRDKIIAKIIKSAKPRNLIFWGPAGCGKTTLARMIAASTEAEMIELSAVASGKKEVEAVLERARQNQTFNKQTILFLDEIHRFNKAQQDLFLPALESGLITLIGATTENPSFEIITPLLSRCQLIVMKALNETEIIKILKRALKRANLNKKVSAKAYNMVAWLAQGDARKALNILELALDLAPEIDHKTIELVANKDLSLYDKKGDQHYNLISALIKSMRGSDVDASLYYLARLIQAGEEPKFIARRLIIFASEDIGLAGNGALALANACFEAVTKVGMPEAKYILFHAVSALAKSKKSRQTTDAMHQALDLARKYPNLAVPTHLRNPSTKLMKDLGYGQDYQWTADFKHPKGFLPEQIKDQKIFK